MSGVSKKDHVRNVYARHTLQVTLINNKLRECRLRCFGLLKHSPDNYVRESDTSRLKEKTETNPRRSGGMSQRRYVSMWCDRGYGID